MTTTLVLVWAFDYLMTIQHGTFAVGVPPKQVTRTVEQVKSAAGTISEPHGGTITWEGDQPELRRWCDYLGPKRCHVTEP